MREQLLWQDIAPDWYEIGKGEKKTQQHGHSTKDGGHRQTDIHSTLHIIPKVLVLQYYFQDFQSSKTLKRKNYG